LPLSADFRASLSLSASHNAHRVDARQFHGKDNFSVKRKYELTFILKIDSNEQNTNEVIDEVRGWIETDGSGTITKVDRWGRRRLAYEIDKQREGNYIYVEADIDPENIAELERNLRLSTSVIRHLLVRADE
jgi:small subunit ribosomal protein S6